MDRVDWKRSRDTAICVFLFVLNLLIARRLLSTEYLIHYGSIEPVFFTIARYFRDHWSDPGWFREWFGGMPFEYTYQPLLHYTSGITALLTGWSAGRAFHFVLGIGYCLGPVGVYLMAKRLSKRWDVGLTAALIYSLFSPSGIFIPPIIQDMGTVFGARRLHTALVYGDGPQVFGLTFLPFAIFLLDRVVKKPTFGRWIAASLCVIAVPATNIPAGLSLFMTLTAYLFAGDVNTWVKRGLTIAGVGITGYLLIARWIPLSGLLLTFHNTQLMDPDAKIAGKQWRYVALILTMLILAWALSKLTKQVYVRFAVLFTTITFMVVLGKVYFNIDFLTQAERMHLVMEMAIAALCSCAIPFLMQRDNTRVATLTFAVLAGVTQFFHYRSFAHSNIRAVSMTDRSEYKISEWLDQNAHNARTFTPGSVSFWLNVFSKTPQITGCCDQNTLLQAPRYAHYEISTDMGAGDRSTFISSSWLQAMGVRYVATSGAKSTEVYKDFQHPDKFKGAFPEVWRDGDDAIFDLSPQLQSLAHWVQPAELVSTFPENGIMIDPLKKYVAAITDASRPPAALRWVGTREAIVEGSPGPQDVLSLQVAYHPGWHAEAAGKPVPLDHDALGFIVAKPSCNGPCTVEFTFDGGTEAKVLRVVTGGAWIAVLIVFGWLLVRRRSASVHAAS